MLKKGDKIGIVSPATHVKMSDIKQGMDYLTSLGFECVLGQNALKKQYWMAGTPEERAIDINSFFKDKDIKAIFCTRGGAGSQFILDHIDYKTIKQNPKPLFGFSDITSLQLAIYSQTKVPSYTGFLLMYDFKDGKIDNLVEKSLLDILANNQTNIIAGQKVNGGQAEGVLLGGTLSMLIGLSGTEYFPLEEDTILLLEDVGEKTYRLDLFFDQLKKNKQFHNVKGIILGQFANCENDRGEDIELEEVVKEFCKDLTIPIIKEFPYGHVPSRYILPLGKKVHLNADKCEITFI